MLFVGYTTAPFVNYVHIRLPIFARRSREQLVRWSKNIPLDTEIDMTTIRVFGLARVTRMRLAELRMSKKRGLAVANLQRIAPADEVSKRPWWMGRKPTDFYVVEERWKSGDATIWHRVLNAIERGQKGHDTQSKLSRD